MKTNSESRTVCDASGNQLKFHHKWYRLSPQDNITTGEVAAILKSLCIAIDDTVYNKLPLELRRHFLEDKE